MVTTQDITRLWRQYFGKPSYSKPPEATYAEELIRESTPTQKDKTSPRSEFVESELLNFILTGKWPPTVSFHRVANTNSMEPWIDYGDIVVVHNTGPDFKYRVGQVILYYHPQLKLQVLHEIIKIDGDVYTLKGINNKYPDAPVNKKQIYGYACAVLWGKKTND